MEADFNLLRDSGNVSNVKIVCQDGVIHSHKLVVASKSLFLKKIFREFPVGDEITVFLPDFSLDEMSKDFLNIASLKNSIDERLFSVKIKCEIDPFPCEDGEIFADNDDDDDSGSMFDDSDNEMNSFSDLSYGHRVKSYQPTVKDDPDTKNTMNPLTKAEKLRISKLERASKLERYNQALEVIKRYKFWYKFYFGKHFILVSSGNFESFRKVAQQFQISRTVLADHVKNGTTPSGKGSGHRELTDEEENQIVKM